MLGHLLKKGVNSSELFVEREIGAMDSLCRRVSVGQCKFCRSFETWSHKHKESYRLIFQETWKLIGVWDDCFDSVLVKLEAELSDLRTQHCLEQLYHLLRHVFVVGDKHRFASSLFCTPLQQGFGSTFTQADSMYLAEFAVVCYELHDFVRIAHLPVSQ